MRCFLAILLPEEITADLRRHLEPRREAEPDWRWTDPDWWHLTLAFIPDLPDHLEEPLVEDLTARLADTPAVQMSLDGAGAFPDPIRARVLWMGIAGPDAVARLADLSRRGRALASRHGADVEGRRFSPHLTVARRAGLPQPGAARLLQALDTYRSAAFEVDAISLIRSHLGEGPRRAPRYEIAATIPLRG